MCYDYYSHNYLSYMIILSFLYFVPLSPQFQCWGWESMMYVINIGSEFSFVDIGFDFNNLKSHTQHWSWGVRGRKWLIPRNDIIGFQCEFVDMILIWRGCNTGIVLEIVKWFLSITRHSSRSRGSNGVSVRFLLYEGSLSPKLCYLFLGIWGHFPWPNLLHISISRGWASPVFDRLYSMILLPIMKGELGLCLLDEISVATHL